MAARRDEKSAGPARGNKPRLTEHPDESERALTDMGMEEIADSNEVRPAARKKQGKQAPRR